MTAAQSARIAIIVYSLSITGVLFVFFVLSQAFGIRFDYEQGEQLRLVDIVVPVFFGYLGAASHFVFNANRGREVSSDNTLMLRILVHGPFILFIVFTVALMTAFQLSRLPLPPDAPLQPSMSINDLSRWISISLALLSCTVSILASYLFGSPPQKFEEPGTGEVAKP
jgi:hypothetical protein